jgi:hypothetical protein
VVTVARTGPTSAMSAKNSRNASAVQTTPRVATAAITCPDGHACGSWVTAAGAYTSAASSREAAITPRAGRSLNRLLMISGPIA